MLAYSDEKNVQILISLLKAHHIKKIVASPGAMNSGFVACCQADNFFEMYSVVDERSAGYIACGLSVESNEPVIISCTGATASRNYLSAMTEAYYRKIPIIAITSTTPVRNRGNNFPQFVDRSVTLNDVVKKSILVPITLSNSDESYCKLRINDALLELYRHGGGPIHINLECNYNETFNVMSLPNVNVIERFYCSSKDFPSIDNKKIGIFVGAHKAWSKRLTDAVDGFCAMHNAVVICDLTSNYKGKYGLNANIITDQDYSAISKRFDLIIHIGDISGAYTSIVSNEVWRVNPDGEIRDTFGMLTKVFEMEEHEFFEHYCKKREENNTIANEWKEYRDVLISKIPELPFSNIWIAQQTISKLPHNTILHLGILNSLRSWNFFEVSNSITCYSNTGGFGIDGCVSTIIGASLASKTKLIFGVVGDLALFYDLNSLGNRHIGNNIRLLVINNGRGTEFTNYNHKTAQFGSDTDDFIAAAGHFGNKSTKLLKHFADDLGFEYLSANSKAEYLSILDKFVSPNMSEKSMVLEVFTNSVDESDALKIMRELESPLNMVSKENMPKVAFVKKAAKRIIGENNIEKIRKRIK